MAWSHWFQDSIWKAGGDISVSSRNAQRECEQRGSYKDQFKKASLAVLCLAQPGKWLMAQGRGAERGSA